VLIDARTLPPDEQLDADVCIVGAGPAGIVIALELLATGARICMLENGGREPQRALGGESVGHPYFGLEDAGVRAFGGSLPLWGTGEHYWHAVPMDRLDFEHRAGINYSGWPFDRTHLMPFYERAAAISDLGAFADSPDNSDDVDLAAQLPVRPGRIVSSFMQLGYGTFARHFDRLSASNDAHLILHAQAAELRFDQDVRHVHSVRALSIPGRSFSVRARVVVLAAGGIENPRLLLLSDRGHRSGVGNEHDLVGRFFMEHVSGQSGFVSSPALLEHPRLYEHREERGARFRPIVRLHEDLVRRGELLSVAFLLDPMPSVFAGDGFRSLTTLRRAFDHRPRPPDLLGHTRSVLLHFGDVARATLFLKTPVGYLKRPALYLKTRPSRRRAPVLLLRVQGEQAPNPDSRITLADGRDAYGLRRPRLDWRLSGGDMDSIRRTQDVLDEELGLAGLGAVEDKLGTESPPAVMHGLCHHIGTTRMHVDPKQGVVDPNCKLHDVDNLFVAGSSVFPTSGWANPTLTIVALAIRLADHLKTVFPRG
jgi:choline dehydrogenase-like flavoprotein